MDNSFVSLIPCVKRNRFFFYFSYCVFVGYSILLTSFFGQYLEDKWKYIFLLCITLLVVHELYVKVYTLRHICFVLLLSALTLMIMINAHGPLQNSIALSVIFCFCARFINNDMSEFVFVSLIISTLSLMMVVLSSQIGVIPDYIDEAGGRFRHFLGFRYALYGPTLLSNITSLFIYYKKEKFSFFNGIVLLLFNIWFYFLTNSRLCFGLTLLLVIVALLFAKKPFFFEKIPFLAHIMIASFFIAAIFSILITLLYDPSIEWMDSVNRVFGDRLYLANYSVETQGVYLLGNRNFVMAGNGLGLDGSKDLSQYLYVDNAYIQFLQQYGVISSLITISMLSYSMFITWKKRDYYLLVIMSFVALHCIVDDLKIYSFFNSMWVVAIAIMLNKDCCCIPTNLRNNNRI